METRTHTFMPRLIGSVLSSFFSSTVVCVESFLKTSRQRYSTGALSLHFD